MNVSRPKSAARGTELLEIEVAVAESHAPAPQTMAREAPRPLCATIDEAKSWAGEWWAQQPTDESEPDGREYSSSAALLAKLEPRASGV